jgi:hypothetical protein
MIWQDIFDIKSDSDSQLVWFNVINKETGRSISSTDSKRMAELLAQGKIDKMVEETENILFKE